MSLAKAAADLGSRRHSQDTFNWNLARQGDIQRLAQMHGSGLLPLDKNGMPDLSNEVRDLLMRPFPGSVQISNMSATQSPEQSGASSGHQADAQTQSAEPAPVQAPPSATAPAPANDAADMKPPEPQPVVTAPVTTAPVTPAAPPIDSTLSVPQNTSQPTAGSLGNWPNLIKALVASGLIGSGLGANSLYQWFTNAPVANPPAVSAPPAPTAAPPATAPQDQMRYELRFGPDTPAAQSNQGTPNG